MIIVGKHVSRLSGYAPALPTPFQENGGVDAAAFERLCDRQIREGATALVACGTTGEAPTLSDAEHDTIVRIAVELAQGRVPVIAGTGSNATSHAIELTLAPMLCCRSCPITTSQHKPGCMRIFKRSPTRRVCQLVCTMFLLVRSAVWRMKPSPGLLNAQSSLG